ncbi:PAS domain S-box protein [Orrella marina]|uniref:Uncharacterized protein n=1 Tax=Orrella marina TaxID=2163011 RepID=A0A2R4XK33_9BURK|nr:PAS domain S-box protein [Orrella marina]AWB34138.1 hypothetical protein DBV39_10960 [Orrella marina]
MSETLNLKVLYALPPDGEPVWSAALADRLVSAAYDDLATTCTEAQVQASLHQLCRLGMAIRLEDGRFVRADVASADTGPDQAASLAELMAQIATTLINNDPRNVGQYITSALERVTTFTGADRGYVFDYDLEAGLAHYRYEWCAPGISPQIERYPSIPLADLDESDWVAPHREGRSVVIDDVQSLSNSRLRTWLELQDIQSVVVVPIMADGVCLGFIGFDSVRQHRHYGQEEVRLLETLARMLANLHWKEVDRRALDRAHDNLDIIVEGTQVGTWIWWLRAGHLEINENWASMLGYTRRELDPVTIETWERLCHPDDLARAKELIAQNMDGTLTYYDALIRMRHKDGHWVLVQTRGRLMQRDPSEGMVAVGIHQDVTEREHANHDLKMLSDIISRSPVVAFRWANLQGWPVVYVSPTVEILGYKASDFTDGRRVFLDLIHPDDSERIAREVSHYIAHGPDMYKQIYRLRHGTGSWIWVDDFTWLTRDSTGNVVEINGVLQDISGRKQLERELRLYATLIDNSVDVVVLRDRDLRYRTANSGFMRLAGKSLDDVIGRTDAEVFAGLIDPASIETYQDNARRALSLARGDSFVVEDQIVDKAGELHEFRSRHFPVFDEETNDLLGAATISIEITDLKRTQVALENSGHRFRALFERSPVGIMIHDPDTGDVLDANNQALSSYQVQDIAQLKAMRVWGQPAPFSPADAQTWVRQAVQSGRQHFEWRSINPQGKVVWESVTLEPIRVDGALRVMSISIDITEKVIAQQALAQSEARFRGLLEHLPNVAVQGYDRNKQVIFWNKGSESIYGYTARQAMGQPMNSLIVPAAVQKDLSEKIDRWLDGGEAIAPSEMDLVDKDGATKVVFSSKVLRDSSDGEPELYCIDVDLTEHRQAQKRLELLARVFSHSYDGVVITDSTASIIEVNDRYCEMTGYSRKELIGQNPSILHSGRQDRAFYESMWRHLNEHGFWVGQIWNRSRSGEQYAIETRITTLKSTDGEVVNFIANVTDITERLDYEDRLKRVAFYDQLTGLPNRASVSDALRQALARHKMLDLPLAVVFIDLDEFKLINDSHDHETGDRYLQNIARRLESIIRKGDIAARFGGDEFVLVIQNMEQASAEHPVFRRLLDALRDPVVLDGKTLRLTASFGVTFYPQDGAVDADQLLRQADQAMYSAKQHGKNQIVFFDSAFERSIIERNARTEQLRRAIENGEMVLHYQPQVDMAAGTVFGVEALVRWNHPSEGLLYPDKFLDLIQGHERLGLMLTRWVLAQAFTDLEDLLAKGHRIGMSVNIIIAARESLRISFMNELRDLLHRHPGISPDLLTLEVVENILIDDLSLATKTIQEIQNLGVQISLDDFGTGFSSLSYLKHLSFNELKIDQGFVRDMLADREDMTIVQAVVSLSKSFNVPVIAEGVETSRHALMLLRLGCQRAQGYAISRPMPVSALIPWLEQWQPDSSWRGVRPIPTSFYPVALMMAAHEGWVDALELYLQGERSDPPVLDSRSCGFGELVCQYASSDQICVIVRQAQQHHIALHDAGKDAIIAYQKGDVSQAWVHFSRVREQSKSMNSMVWQCLEQSSQAG